MMLSNIMRILKDTKIIDFHDIEIAGITHDSRKVRPGFIFVAIKGHKNDGHIFVPDAITNGAVLVVTEKWLDLDSNITQVVVPDSRKALSTLSNLFFEEPSKKLKVIGITGTNGKTTTSFLVKSIIEGDIDNLHPYISNIPQSSISNLQPASCNPQSHPFVGLIGTIEYIIGRDRIPARETTPESVDIQNLLAQMVGQGIKYAVMEVSSHALIQHRTSDVDFHTAIFTNLTPEHLDYHHTFSEYREAKSRLFRGLNRSSFAILNADDDASRFYRKNTRANVILYGIKKGGDVTCKILDLGPDSIDMILSCNKKEIEIILPLIGMHNVYNALAAAAACMTLGIGLETIKKGLSMFNNVPGRLERIDCGQDFKVFIDYAHNPNALEVVLRALRQLNPRRILLVFGCGGDRDRGKRPQMGHVAERLADRFWITNDNPRTEDPMDIITEIKSGIKSKKLYTIQPDRRLAITEAIREAEKGDIVIIAGKGHETGQIIGNKVFSLNDKEITRDILSKVKNA